MKLYAYNKMTKDILCHENIPEGFVLDSNWITQIQGLDIDSIWWRFDESTESFVSAPQTEIDSYNQMIINEEKKRPKPRNQLVDDIMAGLDEQGRITLMRTIRKYTDFIICLDKYDYSGVDIPLQDAVNAGDITQEFMNYVKSKLPEV